MYKSRAGIQKAKSFKRRISAGISTGISSDRNANKVRIAEPEYHYFKRTWRVQHRLDRYSTLLNRATRQELERNGGHWPEHLKNYIKIRQSMLHFDELIVTLNGTCKGQAVYAQKVYKPMDIIIGYKFANMEYYDSSKDMVNVDLNLIDDVVEQGCGEAEPLIRVDDLSNVSMHT